MSKPFDFLAYRKPGSVPVLTWCVFLFLITNNTPTTQAQSVHKSLRKGDSQYDKDQYKEAEKHYRDAADLEFANPKALYNLGNALYQQGDWEDAGERYGLAVNHATRPTMEADALHNLGNAFLKQRKFKEAVNAYEKSLRLRPGDADTKMNLQMAKKKLKEEEQKEKQKQQDQQKQNQGQEDQKDQNQSQAQNQQDRQPQMPQNKPNQEQNGPPQQPDQQQESPQPGKLKKEEAQRMLETAIGPEDQRNARKYRSVQQQRKPKGSKKDW